MGWLAPGLFPPSVGVVLCCSGQCLRGGRGCYNNTEKPIFLLVGGKGGMEALAMLG